MVIRNFKHFNDLGLPVSQIYKWLILKHTIKKDWMTLLQNNVFQSCPRFPYLSLCGLRIELEWLSNRLLYKTLIKSKQEIFSGRHALQNMIQEEINWNEAFEIIYNTTIETKLREFQFKLLHNILPTNSILYRWKLTDSPRCCFCFISNETIDHLFCSCPNTITLYLHIKEWLLKKDIVLPDLSISKVLIGIQPRQRNCLINHIILIFKYCVYSCRNNEQNLNLNYFISLLKEKEKIENTIALNNNKHYLHIKKWEPLMKVFRTTL